MGYYKKNGRNHQIMRLIKLKNKLWTQFIRFSSVIKSIKIGVDERAGEYDRTPHFTAVRRPEPIGRYLKRMILILFLAVSFSLNAEEEVNLPGSGSIEGRVTARATQQPLAGVNIILKGTPMGAASDINGNFLIWDVPLGTYQLEAVMIGYQIDVETNVRVLTNRVTMVNFELNTMVLEGEEIFVTIDYFNKDNEKPISSKSLSPMEIRSSPGSAEDIFRVIQSMPGVSAAGGKSANLVVRGGSPDENRTLLDNIEIYNPLHFARSGSSMGVISIINPSLLEGVDFLTGGFPAKYGDNLSSVFEMRLKEGNRTHMNTDMNVNLAGFGLLVDGPLPGNGSLVFSGRRGFFDLITSAMNRPAAPQYWDFVGKVTYNFGPKHKLSLIGFYYLDLFEKSGATVASSSNANRNYDFISRDDFGSAIGFNWRYLFSSNGYMLTTAAVTTNGWKSLFGTESEPRLNGDDIMEREIHFKSELTYKINTAAEIKTGLFWKGINSDHFVWKAADTTRTGFLIPSDTIVYHPSPTYKSGGFVQGIWHPIERLSLNAGLRADLFEFTGKTKISPRLGMSYYLMDKTTLNAAYGHFYQSPEAYQVAQDSANLSLQSSRAIHYIAGLEHLFKSDTKFSVEVYHKELDDLFVGSDTSNILSNSGTGYARGVEFYIQKKMNKNLVGSVAYTYSLSKRRDSGHLPEYNFEYDRPHNFTLVGGYKLSGKWQIGAKFQYASGNPYTPVVGAVQKGSKWYVVDGDYNSARYPDYHRLDIRIDRRFHFRNWMLSVYLDLWNAYNRDNVNSYRYNVDAAGLITREATYDFPMLPIFGISAQF